MTLRAWLLAFALLTPLFPVESLQAAPTQDALQNYSRTVYATYSDAYETARKLQSAVSALVARPSAEALQAAQKA